MRLQLAEQIYNVLVNEGGAREKEREDFIRYITDEQDTHEWRFGGTLGSGGKLYVNISGVYVQYYQESTSPAREKIVDIMNAKIDKLTNRVRIR